MSFMRSVKQSSSFKRQQKTQQPQPQQQKKRFKPRLQLEDDDLSMSQMSKDQLLQLQINQLKRENNFLKKKLQDCMNQKRQLLLEGFGLVRPRRKKLLRKGFKKQTRDGIQLSFQYFFKEINNMITSVAQVFRLEFNIQQQMYYLQKSAEISKQMPKRSHVYRKQLLHRKLQKIILDAEEKRYPLLLEVFTDFYRSKTEAQKNTITFVDSITQKTLDLNRWVMQKLKNQTITKTLKRSHMSFDDICHEEDSKSQNCKGYKENSIN